MAKLCHDLVDDLAICLALQLGHYRLHDHALVFGGDSVRKFFLQIGFDLFRGHQFRRVFADHIIAELVGRLQLGSLSRAGVDLFFYTL